ncbi:hypothetical protein F53441_11053 [Fusarium austroafricanum]|uniref:Uncharacterized protein n=1 Tax=Fusarium austroafricanum TaxID=2364996 RepID=A0A8H4NRC0_9HYPO|nr:hypothetical protein F53441_11053 [Fusarium austroafricanum]
MSPLVTRVARSAVVLRPLPAAQRSLRTSSILRDSEPYEAKPPKQNRDHNKILGAGVVAGVAAFWWFYRGGKPTLDAAGEKPPTK